MEINVLGSGSSGNCILVTDKDGHQIMLDCGLKYEKIVPFLKTDKFNFILVTHSHSDHTKGIEKFEKFYYDIISYENVEDGRAIDTAYWKVLPMELEHNVQCFGFLIYNKVENKKIAYITDTIIIPKFNDVDCAIIECNWDEAILDRVASNGILLNKGFLNHLSKQQIIEFFENTGVRPKNLILSHLSNSGLVDIKTLKNDFKEYANNVFIAMPGMKVDLE